MPIEKSEPAPEGVSPTLADAHGHAALLLVESLIHGLLARSIITTDHAIEIVDAANEVQREIAEAADANGMTMWRSHALLTSIARSLRHDVEPNTAP